MRKYFTIWLFILNLALGLSSQEPASQRRPNCIRMTPEKELQIDTIIEKLSGFLNKLTMEHEHFDIRLIKLDIEQHSDEEVEEKETMLQLFVNDCQMNDGDEEIDRNQKKALDRDDSRAEADESKAGGKKNANVMYLNLEENGRELLEAMDKTSRSPRLVYVQKDRGHLDYLFYKKK